MSTKIWKSLPIRTGVSIAISALFLNCALTYFFYNQTFDQEIKNSKLQIAQLFQTIKNTASVAAYLDNAELATEVTQGLINNDLVAGAQITSITGLNILTGNIHPAHESHFIEFPLLSPFMPDENAGVVTIHPNQVLIDDNARRAALAQALTIGAHSTFIVILVIFLVHRQLTKPLKELAETLHKIDPGSNNRLSCPKHNQDNEIGQLVLDTNKLLTATQNTIEGERRLREYMETLEKRFRLIFEKASSGITLINDKGKVILHNPSFEKLIPNFNNLDLNTLSFEDLFVERVKVYEALKQAASQTTPVTLDLQLATQESFQGGNRWLHALISGVTDERGNQLAECILYDISERAQREQRTKLEAERDPLTQLLNRRAGEKRLEESISEAQHNQTKAAIMLVDLDRFKPINDTHGHEAGDQVLIAVANRLTGVLRKTDSVIRWGGDEFLIVVKQGHEALDPAAVSKKLLSTMVEPISIGAGKEVQIGASIGVAICPEHALDKDILIELADKAMYHVKQQGRDGFHIYSNDAS